MKDTNYVLVRCEERWSHRNLNYYFHLTFLDPDLVKLYECSVDPDMTNWSHWQPYVTLPNPLGLYTNLKLAKGTTKNNLPIISADSHPRLVETLTEDEVCLLVEALINT
jgi:hypothetical protein